VILSPPLKNVFIILALYLSPYCRVLNMDGLTALALAGNVIQFVDFGTKLISRPEELYKSTRGSLGVHDEIELVTADLKDLITKLSISFLEEVEDGDLGGKGGPSVASFRKVCDEAVNVADEIVLRLQKLKRDGFQVKCRGGIHKKVLSLQPALKGMWSEKELAILMRRLSTLKESLESHVLFSIR
jgi:hypothetical protein